MKTKSNRRAFVAAAGALAVGTKGKEQNMKNTIQIRKADERGIAEHGWLHSRFSPHLKYYIVRYLYEIQLYFYIYLLFYIVKYL